MPTLVRFRESEITPASVKCPFYLECAYYSVWQLDVPTSCYRSARARQVSTPAPA